MMPIKSKIDQLKDRHRLGFILSGLAVMLSSIGPLTMAAFTQTAREVYVPISFKTNGQELRTSACLGVTETIRQIPSSQMDSGIPAADRAFESVLEAIHKKDKEAFLQLSDPQLGRDPKRFEDQSRLYFGQFQNMKLVGVERLYMSDGLLIFLTRFTFKGAPLVTAMAFTMHEDGTVFFLPYDTDHLSYRLLEQWLLAKWGPIQTEDPSYCTSETIDLATYRLALTSSNMHPSLLYLRGGSIGTQGPVVEAATKVQSAVKAIDDAVSREKMDDFFNLLPEANRASAHKAYAEATNDARTVYRETLLRQQPFFVFDASPLLIAYTKTPAGTVQVMYFTSDSRGSLFLANAQQLTLVDRVFKTGVLYDAAKLAKPFSNIATGPNAASTGRQMR